MDTGMPWKKQTDISKLQGTKRYENYQKRGTLPGQGGIDSALGLWIPARL